MTPSARLGLVAVLFFASGATGLVYEVAFSKSLAPIFGATAYAVSAVLAAFMAGLAIGAQLGGRLLGSTGRPLLIYGVLEALIGAWCAATPRLFSIVEQTYVELATAQAHSLAALNATRMTLAFAIIIVPTMCMGATLPLLARLTTDHRAGLSRLYGINTAGGALGALSCAYLLLPMFGLSGTMRLAASVNLGIALVAIAAGLRGPPIAAAPPSSRASASAPSASRALVWFGFASGFMVLATEVVFTHLLAVLIGNSAYAFGLMLALFLSCLALGAALARRLDRHLAGAALGRGLAWAAFGLAVTMPVWDRLSDLFAWSGQHLTGWASREALRAVAAALPIALPTVLMGTTFPLLLLRVGGADAHGMGRSVGRLVAYNTIGTIAGSALAGYVLLPALGSQRALAAIGVGFAVLAVIAAWREPARRETTLAIASLGVTAMLLWPSWDLARLTNGANVYFAYGPRPDRIAMVREDVHGGITTVAVRDGVTTLYTNGKFQGDDGPEMLAQRRFAHFPALFLERSDRALVVGLGTGVTLGAVAAYPFSRIDVAEISPAIVEASRTYFATPSLSVLDDPRVALTLEDGRSLLLLRPDRYDLITIELTSVWFAGASSLYSTEFYRLCKRRLAAGGVLQQWVQLHHIRPRELGVIVRTLMAELPHVALFVGGEQGILVASETPLVASRERLDELAKSPTIRATLDGRSPESLLDDLVSSGDELRALVDHLAQEHGGPLLSTDDNLLLEAETPKGNALDYGASLDASLALVRQFATPDVRARHLGP